MKTQPYGPITEAERAAIRSKHSKARNPSRVTANASGDKQESKERTWTDARAETNSRSKGESAHTPDDQELIEFTVDKIEQHATIHDYTQVGHCVREAIGTVAAERDKLREQREELLKVCKEAAFEFRGFMSCCDEKEIRDSFQGFDKAEKRCRSAIQKAEAQ